MFGILLRQKLDDEYLKLYHRQILDGFSAWCIHLSHLSICVKRASYNDSVGTFDHILL